MKRNKWKSRYVSYTKAFNKLRQITDNIECDNLTEIERDSLIKRFELTFELSWMMLKDFLELQGETDLYGSRNTYKKALNRGLIENGEVWMDMIESRVQTSHIYDEDIAIEIVGYIYSDYVTSFQQLKISYEKLLSEY